MRNPRFRRCCCCFPTRMPIDAFLVGSDEWARPSLFAVAPFALDYTERLCPAGCNERRSEKALTSSWRTLFQTGLAGCVFPVFALWNRTETRTRTGGTG